MSQTKELELAKTSSLVAQIADTQDIVAQMKKFQGLKAELLDPEIDFQKISDKNYVKKSGWRKLALAFGISDSIVDKHKFTREDGTFIWEFTVRAVAPNGRYTEASAACDSSERKFAHLEHDVYATAQTRAKNRAISDLIGAGEISAEEIEGPENNEKEAPKDAKQVGHSEAKDSETFPNGPDPKLADDLSANASLGEELAKYKWLYKEGTQTKLWKQGDPNGYLKIKGKDNRDLEEVYDLIAHFENHGGRFVYNQEIFWIEDERGRAYRRLSKT